jgi:hypothetical protein
MAQASGPFELDQIAVQTCIFLHDDRVSAKRYGRSGKDAYRLALFQFTGKSSPRLGRPDHLKSVARHYICRAQRVSIHGTCVERRLVMARKDRLEQDPSGGLLQGHSLT